MVKTKPISAQKSATRQPPTGAALEAIAKKMGEESIANMKANTSERHDVHAIRKWFFWFNKENAFSIFWVFGLVAWASAFIFHVSYLHPIIAILALKALLLVKLNHDGKVDENQNLKKNLENCYAELHDIKSNLRSCEKELFKYQHPNNELF